MESNVCAAEFKYEITDVFAGEVIDTYKTTTWNFMTAMADTVSKRLAKKNDDGRFYVVKFFINGDEANMGLAVSGHVVHQTVGDMEPERDPWPTQKIYS